MIATVPPTDMIQLLSQAPPMVVLVVIVVMFLRHIHSTASSMAQRDDQFIDAMRSLVRDVEQMTQRSDAIGTRMVEVMGEATEALRRIDADLSQLKASR